MINKGTKIYSVMMSKCPACHEGDFFKSHPYNLPKAGDIYEKCNVCAKAFSKEPGFYYGAMYVSYAITVALSLLLWLLNSSLEVPFSILNFILFYAAFILLLSPYIYAKSKIIWANIFIHYQSKK